MNREKRTAKRLMLIVAFFCIPVVVFAQVPGQMNFQGRLTDNQGYPVDDDAYSMDFKLYNVASGGSPLWNEVQSVQVVDGVYSVLLGQPGNELSADLFAAGLYLGVAVGSDAEMSPRFKLTSVAYALVADRLSEGSLTTVMLADQAVTGAKIAPSTISASNIIDGTGSNLNSDLLDNHDADYFAPASAVTDLTARVSALETANAALQVQVTTLIDLLKNVTRTGDEITFSGVNVHVVNGTGTTEGAPNSFGNLIVGYNEMRGSGDNRSGSHNVVVGSRQNYSSYGGLVAGRYNTISGSYASVSGGGSNTASGDQSSVTGGASNTASGNNASISGGSYNKASGRASFVGGGGSGNSSDGNEAFGDYSAILGGHTNLTGDQGKIDHSIGQNATISGGIRNRASGNASFVGGGGGPNEYDGNMAFANYSAILGGRTNCTGDVLRTWNVDYCSLTPGSNHNEGTYSTVISGFANRAGGDSSSVSGGIDNSAVGDFSSVSGGLNNGSIGDYSSISGGRNNRARGAWSSISGGLNNSAFGEYSFIGGGGHSNASFGNVAHANLSVILGGANNTTGVDGEPTTGELSTVAGGDTNTASGWAASVGGGQGVTADTDKSWKACEEYSCTSP